MSDRKTKFAVATAAAAALLLGFAPLAQSHDALWHQLEVTDGTPPSPAHAPDPKAATGARADQRAPGTYFEHEREITDGASANPDHARMKADAAKGQFVGTRAAPATSPAPAGCDPWLKQIHQSDGYSYSC